MPTRDPQATVGLGGARVAAERAAALLPPLLAGTDDPLPALAEVLGRYGETEFPARADLADLRAAARELHAVFAATDTDTAAARLNELFARHARPPRLSTHGGATPWHLHVDAADDGPWGQWLRTSTGLALAILLAERQAPPGALCAAADCERPFLAHGVGSPRQYCSPRCATRVRVAAHRARRRSG